MEREASEAQAVHCVNNETPEPEQLRRTMAIHEATHAVFAKLCCFPVKSVLVSATGESGQERDNNPFSTKPVVGDTVGSFYYEMLTSASARVGEIAGEAYRHPQALSSDFDDVQSIATLLCAIHGPFDPSERIERQAVNFKVTQQLWDDAIVQIEREEVGRAINALTLLLLRQEVVTGAELDALLSEFFSAEDIGRREPILEFPEWYIQLVGKTKDELLELRRDDYAEIWRFYEAQQSAAQKA